MGRIAAIRDWAREIGPQRLIFGLTAVGAVYLRFGLALAGYQGSDVPLWVISLTGVGLFCAVVSGWKTMPFTRRAIRVGVVHAFIVLLVLLMLWGLPADLGPIALARPQAPEDFNLFLVPILALNWATQALARQGPRDHQW